MKTSLLSKIIAAVVVTEIVGSIGTIFTAPAIGTWYASLAKPAFTPPDFIFAPVWIILFALMGIAAGLVWGSKEKGSRKNKSGRKGTTFFGIGWDKLKALVLFDTQLILNVIWSYFFFGLRNPALALAEIILLWVAIAATIYYFRRIDSRAAWLMIPYIAWVTFAVLLNVGIVGLN